MNRRSALAAIARYLRGPAWVAIGWAVLTQGLASEARAGTIRTDVSDGVYRELASDALYDAVGYITWRQQGSQYSASGALITDEWVLTAAHVVEGTDLLGSGITGMTVRLDGTRYAAAEWVANPAWSEREGSLDAGVDIGLIRLSRAITQIDPVILYAGSDERGQVGTIVGFGNTGTGATGYEDDTAGTKRAGQNVIDTVQRNATGGTPLLSMDFDNPARRTDNSLGSRTALDLEYLAAPGDSGGPLFIDVDGVAQVAGIVSYISAFDGTVNSDYGDQASFTRVSAYLDWIESVVGSLNPLRPGDFDADGLLTIRDLDALTRAVLAPAINVDFDLNGDGDVTSEDRLYWVESLFGTHVGDANLDLKFDSTDFVRVFQAGQYEDTIIGNSTWESGDWNGDGDFDTQDFLFALQRSQFEADSGGAAASLGAAKGVAASRQTVPEPTAWTLVKLGMLWAWMLRQRYRG